MPHYAPDWTSLIPPLATIVLAIATKRIVTSLTFGIWLGWTLIESGPLQGTLAAGAAFIAAGTRISNAMVISFCLLVGAVMALSQRSGGVTGLVDLISRRGIASTRRGAGLLAFGIGLAIFIESSITSLVCGTVSRPLFDRLRISREKLAYICDSTSAPVCILIPLNGWGAFIAGLLAAQGVARPVEVMISAIPLNIYPIVTLIMVAMTIIADRDFGPMIAAQRRAAAGQVLPLGARPLVSEEVTGMLPKPGVQHRTATFALPIIALILGVPLGLWITGDGDLLAGSGTTAVFGAVVMAVTLAASLGVAHGIFSPREVLTTAARGVWGLRDLGILMLLAFTIGDTFRELGTGEFLASLSGRFVDPGLIPAFLFLIAAVMAFATGTSWGTFATMIPLGLPIGQAVGMDLGLTLAAILSGGVFGDHCSPISDTTIISSMAAACDHIDHVRTQLPYALIAASIAAVSFLALGFL